MLQRLLHAREIGAAFGVFRCSRDGANSRSKTRHRTDAQSPNVQGWRWGEVRVGMGFRLPLTVRPEYDLTAQSSPMRRESIFIQWALSTRSWRSLCYEPVMEIDGSAAQCALRFGRLAGTSAARRVGTWSGRAWGPMKGSIDSRSSKVRR